MKTIVIGSGLIGITTAYFLQRQGHEVTVIDRSTGPGMETSFANGGILTPSMSYPWNAPGIWRVLLASICNSKSPMKLHLRTLPTLIDWGITFLRNSSSEAFERNTLSNLKLALYSLETLQTLRQQIGINYNCKTFGTVRIFKDQKSFLHGQEAAIKLMSAGMDARILSRQETVDIEPALSPIMSQLVGGIHYKNDEVGDAHLFCIALEEYLKQSGVKFLFSTPIQSLEVRSNKITAVVGNQERFVADRYVIAAGSYSTLLLRKVGIHLPVKPVKGYSVTFSSYLSKNPLCIPIVDDNLHAAIVPIGEALRIVGTADLSGYNLNLSPGRIQNLMMLMKTVFPEIALDSTKAKPWCGLRAMSADGVPIIGETCIGNLFLNTGHGPLGWTMAAGAGELLAYLIDKMPPPINSAPYALSRFLNKFFRTA